MLFEKGVLSNPYIYSSLIAVGSLLILLSFYLILKAIARKYRSSNSVGEKVLQSTILPLCSLLFLSALYFSIRHLPIISNYLTWINHGFFVLAVLLASWLVMRISTVFVTHWMRVRKKFEKTPQLLNKIIIVTIFLIAVIVILGYFNVEITPLIATLGVGGLAVGLALQNTLSNFFAGLHVLTDKPVQVGDFVELEGKNINGYVDDIGWRSTRLKTLPGNYIVIPNNTLAESIIKNTSAPQKQQSFVFQCGVGYGSDLKKVEKITVDVAKKIQKNVKGTIKDFEPFIRYHTFDDSNINFSVILRIEDYVSKYLVQHEFIKELKARFDKEKIEISWPVRKIYQAKKKVN
ncbi:mechanosensitive ion channel [Candidatus Woesearchaeota archaeon]|nr:mechanosensitive ion channel [Candidatus Woesearchaeota archaeon]